MVKINGVKVQTEGRKPWNTVPSGPGCDRRKSKNGVVPVWDSPEKIQRCLNCTNPGCNGRCPREFRTKQGLPPYFHAGGLSREGEASSIP